jgi:hypothetical protein
LIDKGELLRKDDGKIAWPNGVMLQRNQGEYIVDAYRRQHPTPTAVSAFVQVGNTPYHRIISSIGPSATNEEISQALEVHCAKLDKNRTHCYPNTRAHMSSRSTDAPPVPKVIHEPTPGPSTSPAPVVP